MKGPLGMSHCVAAKSHLAACPPPPRPAVHPHCPRSCLWRDLHVSIGGSAHLRAENLGTLFPISIAITVRTEERGTRAGFRSRALSSLLLPSPAPSASQGSWSHPQSLALLCSGEGHPITESFSTKSKNGLRSSGRQPLFPSPSSPSCSQPKSE